MTDDIPTDWQPLTRLFPFARQTEALMLDTGAQFVDFREMFAADDRFTEAELDELFPAFAEKHALLSFYQQQAQRWQQEPDLSPYKRAVLTQMIADATEALLHVQQAHDAVVTSLGPHGRKQQRRLAHWERAIALGEQPLEPPAPDADPDA